MRQNFHGEKRRREDAKRKKREEKMKKRLERAATEGQAAAGAPDPAKPIDPLTEEKTS